MLYRSGLYNLTCVADNVISRVQTTELVPVVDFWCDMDLEIRHKKTVDAIVTTPQERNRSDAITLMSRKIFRHCDRVSL